MSGYWQPYLKKHGMPKDPETRRALEHHTRSWRDELNAVVPDMREFDLDEELPQTSVASRTRESESKKGAQVPSTRSGRMSKSSDSSDVFPETWT